MVYRVTARGLARQRARQELLLTAARREFGSHGYHATSVPRIVKTALSSIGAFYLYFSSKEDIFVAVLKRIEQELAGVLNAAQRATSADIAQQMQAAVEALVQYLVAKPADARILLLEAPSLGGTIHKAWRSIIQSHTRSVENALRALAPAVDLPDLATAATCWVGSVNEGVLRWLEKPPRERPRAEILARTIVEYNLGAIGQSTSRR